MIGKIKCELCEHFLDTTSSPSDWKCKAFPDGIPAKKIAYIDFDKCDNCQNGIGFKLAEDKNSN